MEICEYKSFSGTTPITEGCKFVGTRDNYSIMSYGLPNSVRIYAQFNSASTVSFNNGLVMAYGYLHGGALPSTLRSIDRFDLGNPIVDISSWNDGLLRIGDYTYADSRLSSSVMPPSNFQDSLKFIGNMAFYHSEVGGSLELKAPFIASRAFEECNKISSIELDISDIDNEGSYIGRHAFATYRGSDSALRPDPPLTDLPLKTIIIKGYETIDNPFGECLLNRLEIEGNGNTTATLGEVAVKNTVIFGDGIEDLRGTYIWGWSSDGTAYTDTYCDSIIFGKDIKYIAGGKPWTEGVLKDGSYAANRIYITKDDGLFLPRVSAAGSLSNTFGACKKIYVPSSVYQDYLNSEEWENLIEKTEPY